MGTKPVPPLVMPFNDSILTIESALKKKGFDIERRYRDELALLQVNGAVIIGDNLEADLGQVYNLTANFSHIDFEDVKKIAETVRQSNKVSRNIAFGGFIHDMEQIYSAIEVKTDLAGRSKYIGVNAPKSGVYENGFQVVHLGYGVDYKTQVLYQLTARDIPTYLYGKVADIVQNPHGTSYKSVVDTEKVFSLLLKDLSIFATGFFCANIQETDLAGHQQDADRYWKILEKADKGLADIITLMSEDDVLVVMADHGNDPFIGHSKHTREMVPVLVHQPRLKGKEFNTLNTLADIGASAAAYFMAPRPQFGEAFALPLQKVVLKGGPTPGNFVHQGEIQ